MHRLNGVGPIDRALAAHPAGVLRKAGKDAGNMVGLVGQTRVESLKLLLGGLHAAGQGRDGGRVRIPQVDMAKFVQTYVLEATADIALHGGCQRRQHMTAQEGTVAIQRVGDLDADLLSGLRVIAERLIVLIADERVAQRLNQAVFGQLVRNTAAAQLIGGQTDLALDRSRGHTYRNLVVSDQSRDFLDQIARLVEIRTPCRRGDGEFAVAAARYGASDIGQDLGNGVHIGVETGHAGDLGSRELDGSAMLGVVHIVRGIAGGATTVFGQQIGAHLCRSGLQGVIDATLEAAGRLGGNLVTTGGTGDRHLVEVRGFQQHVLGFGGHLAIQAAHHAGDAENTGGTIAVRRIGDQQILGAQLMLLAVERDELLALVRTTDHDRAFDLVQIVGVHRLAQIHHHIVRRVHGQRDGAHTATGQAAAHPVRGARRGVEATHDACVVAVAAGHAVNRQSPDR